MSSKNILFVCNYGMTRQNTSTVVNKGVKMCCKRATAKIFTVIGLIVEFITSVAKQRVLLSNKIILDNIPSQ